MIDLHRLSMYYALPGGQRVELLLQVGLHIAASESVAVAGPPGSGMTSMLLAATCRPIGDWRCNTCWMWPKLAI